MFSPNGSYLISIGFRHDKQLIIWQWQTDGSQQQISTQRLSNKVHSVSFSSCGNFFVTAGDRHLKVFQNIDFIF